MVGLIALVAAWSVAMDDGRCDDWTMDPELNPPASMLVDLCRCSIWAIVAAAVWLALWPAAWVDLPGAVGSIVHQAEADGGSPHGWGNFFLGQAVDDPGPLFYPVAMALRLTPWAMLGLALICVRFMVRSVRAFPSHPPAPPLPPHTGEGEPGPSDSPLPGVGEGSRRAVPPAWETSAAQRGGLQVRGPRRADALCAAVRADDQRAGQEVRPLRAADLPGAEHPGRRRAGVATDDRRPTDRRPEAGDNGPRTHRLVLGSTVPWFLVLGSVVLQAPLFSVLCSLFSAGRTWPGIHPYELAYYNPLLGGGPAAARLIPVGWGEGLEQAGAYITAQPDGNAQTVATWYRPALKPYISATLVPLGDLLVPNMVGYAVLYIDQVQRRDDAAATATGCAQISRRSTPSASMASTTPRSTGCHGSRPIRSTPTLGQLCIFAATTSTPRRRRRALCGSRSTGWRASESAAI